MPSVNPMYVVKKGQLYEFRQVRYKEYLARGMEHPHDLCAIATSVEQMHEMIDKGWPNTDYSAVKDDLHA